MSYTHQISKDWDVEYLFREVPAIGSFGWSATKDASGNDIIAISYDGTSETFDAMSAAIAAYPVSYATDKVKPKMLADVTALRWEKQQAPAMFMGMPVLTDDVTIGRITAAAYLMGADPTSDQTRRWKVSDTLWMDFDQPTLIAMGRAIADHIQACFANEEALHATITAAADIDALALIDITQGWPS